MSAEELLQLARAALADIANSEDMNLGMARRKAARVYRETEPGAFAMKAAPEHVCRFEAVPGLKYKLCYCGRAQGYL